MSFPMRAPVIEIRAEDPKMLIIDDDQPFLDGATDFFSRRGFVVTTVRTPESAEKLLADGNTYQIVLTDVNFGKLSNIQGDDFVKENRSLFGKAKCVVISAGEWFTAERRRQFEEAGISFADKGRLEAPVIQISQEENERVARDIRQVIELQLPAIEKITGRKITAVPVSGAIAAGVAPARAPQTQREVPSRLMEGLKRTVIQWLKTRGDLDLPVFSYGDKIYSANSLITEVETESEVGFDHIMMLYKDFEHSVETDIYEPGDDEDDTE